MDLSSAHLGGRRPWRLLTDRRPEITGVGSGDIGADLERGLPIIIGRARQHAERTGRTVETRANQRVVEWVQEAESIAIGADGVPPPVPDEDDTRATHAEHGGTP